MAIRHPSRRAAVTIAVLAAAHPGTGPPMTLLDEEHTT